MGKQEKQTESTAAQVKTTAGNVHKDHRERVRRRARSEGLRHFEPHEILELLLFYSIPREDTNPLGHRLLDRYKTLAGVFDADFADLMQTEGVGEATATLLKLIPELARMYLLSKQTKLTHFDSLDEVGGFLVHFYIGMVSEVPVVLLVNNKQELITEPIELSKGTVSAAPIYAKQIAQLALRHNASGVILAHNHPSGSADPSPEDMGLTQSLKYALQLLEIDLLDHIVVGRGSFTRLIEQVERQDDCFAFFSEED